MIDLKEMSNALNAGRKKKQAEVFKDFTERIDKVLKVACDNGIRIESSGSGIIIEDTETGMRVALCDMDSADILTEFPPIFDEYSYRKL